MKHLILIAASLMIFECGYSQRNMHGHIALEQYTVNVAKTTASGDTVTMTNIADSDTVRMLYAHPDNNGYTSGTNSFNDRAFAERYDFSGSDSSVKVIGLMAQFGGSVTATSTRTVQLKVWQHGADQYVAPGVYYHGFPTSVLDSVSVAATALGIGSGSAQTFFFDAPTSYLSGAFYAGFSMDYDYSALGGDTIALMTSTNGNRTTPDYWLRYNTNGSGDTTSVDTFITVQNATQWSDGIWRDNYTQNDSLYNHLAVYPIVIVGDPTGVHGVTHKALTLFGAYPNPAMNSTNIRFSLKAATNVAVSIVDMSGRTVWSEAVRNFAAGEHIIPVSTEHLAAGQYVVAIRTGDGAALAEKVEVKR